MTIFKTLLAALLIICFYVPPARCEDLQHIHTKEEIYADKSADIAGTDNVFITVAENEKVRDANPEMLGFGTGVDGFSHHGGALIPGTTQITPKAKQLMEEIYKIPCVRFCINGDAMSAVGPLSSRKESFYESLGNGEKIERSFPSWPFGPIELIKMISINNPRALYIMCVDIDDKPENIADFVCLLTDEPGSSGWAILRAQYGVPDPVRLIVEMGNERDDSHGWIYNEKQTNWYIDRAKRIIEAIKAVKPETDIMVCGKTAPWSDPEGTDIYNRAVAKALGKDIQYWAHHLYYGYEFSYQKTFLDSIANALNEALGEEENTVKIICTEHAKWPGVSVDQGDDMLTLQAVLSTGMFLNRMYIRKDVYAANYHTFYAGQPYIWSMVKRLNEDYVKMGMLKLYDLYEKSLGDRVVYSEFTGDSPRVDITSSNCKFSVMATAKGENELNLLMCNRSPDYDINIDFKFNNKFTLIEETVFTAPNIESLVVSKDTEDVFTVTSTEKNQENFTSYKLANKSFVVLKLVTKSNISGGSPEMDDIGVSSGAPSKFTDIDNCWAKNEISKMEELGLIRGISETEFGAKKNITRAEFAAMAARLFALDTRYPNSPFADVSDSDWFYPDVSNMFFEGFMRGDGNGMFRPNDGMTLEEIVAAANRIYVCKKNAVAIDGAEISKNYKNPQTISPWAVEDVMLATKIGLLNKLYENGHLRPSDYANRAEAISILYRLYSAVNL